MYHPAVAQTDTITSRRDHVQLVSKDRAWLTEMGWTTVKRVMAHAPLDVAAMSGTTDTIRVKLDPALNGPAVIFLKRFAYPRASQRLKQAFRGTLFGSSRPRFEFRFLTEMRRRGLPAVRPIAFGEHRRRGFLHAAFLITEGEPDVQSLDALATRDHRNGRVSVEEKRSLTANLARSIRSMHDAGVSHGGLFWRNILVRTGATEHGGISFLDPDRRGRLHDGPVPQRRVIEDLAQFTASAAACGCRAGLSRLMRVYFNRSVGAVERNLIRTIVAKASPLMAAERHRLAIAETIGRLRTHVAGSANDSDATQPAETIDEFFDRLTKSKPDETTLPAGRRSIHFTFRRGDDSDDLMSRTLTLEDGRFTLSDDHPRRPDLNIEADVDTWLAIVAGRADAFALIRSGGLRVSGDTTLLAALAARAEQAM